MTEVLRERAGPGVGVVFSSHQLDLVEEVCEDVVIISRGRVVAEGEIDELKAASGRRHLDVEVVGSGGAWLDGDEPPRGGRARRRPGQAAGRRGRGPRRAARGGARGGRGPPVQLRAAALSELFMEAVTASRSRPVRRTRDEPVARRPAGGDARDPRARPEPRLHAVARCSRWSCSRAGSSSRRSSSATTTRPASRSSATAPPGLVGRSRPAAAPYDVELAVTRPGPGHRRGGVADGRIDAALVVPRTCRAAGQLIVARGRVQRRSRRSRPARSSRCAADAAALRRRPSSSRSSRRRTRTPPR